MTDGRDRRAKPLSDEQIDRLSDELAERVAEKAYQKFSAYVGRSVLRNLLVLIVIGAVGVVAFWKLHLGIGPK